MRGAAPEKSKKKKKKKWYHQKNETKKSHANLIAKAKNKLDKENKADKSEMGKKTISQKCG